MPDYENMGALVRLEPGESVTEFSNQIAIADIERLLVCMEICKRSEASPALMKEMEKAAMRITANIGMIVAYSQRTSGEFPGP